jgi:type III secretion protein J
MSNWGAPWARVGLLAWGLLWAGCETTIQSGLSEGQANEVLVALQQGGIGADKDRDEGRRGAPSWRVTVPSDDTAQALEVLRAHNLPRAAAPGLHEVFGEGSLVPTATEERGRYAVALAGELSRSIETIDGVLSARVHVAIPDARDFTLDAEPRSARASVLIRHRGDDEPYEPEAIQALVAGAVDGLSEEHVSVVGVAAANTPHERAPLVKVGPVWVARGSANLLRGIFATGAVSGMLLAMGLGLVAHRTRRSTRTEARAPAAPAE